MPLWTACICVIDFCFVLYDKLQYIYHMPFLGVVAAGSLPGYVINTRPMGLLFSFLPDKLETGN